MESIIGKALGEGRRVLYEHEAYRLLKLAGISEVPDHCLARTREEAAECFSELPKPLVAKIVSPDVVHKSDVGGVILNIKSLEEALAAYDKIVSNVKRHLPDARVHGILYQHMVPQGLEVIIGAKRDPFFGAVVLFGLGGIFVEIFRDYSMRVTPINLDDAVEMMREIRAYKLLEGYRGQPPRDKMALAEIMFKVSRLMDSTPQILELDLNPVMSYPRGAAVASARIVVGEGGK
ncbi:acetate--CoA ligase family protein [Stetteria hydrogenophila]